VNYISHKILSKKIMDYLTFTERLNLVQSLSKLPSFLASQLRECLNFTQSSPKLKSSAIQLLINLFADKSAHFLIKDLFRDLLPGIVSRFIQNFVNQPTNGWFVVISEIYEEFSAFRPLITQAIFKSQYNPAEKLLEIIKSDSIKENQLNDSLLILKGLNKFLYTCGKDIISSWWDLSPIIQITELATKKLTLLLSDLLKITAMRIIGYSPRSIENFIGKSRSIELTELILSDSQKFIENSPTSLAHFLESPNTKEIFLSNSDFCEDLSFTVPGAVNILKKSSTMVYTNSLKKTYKTLSRLIIYDQNKPILLMGPQGSGKTSLIEQLANDWNLNNNIKNVSNSNKLIQIYMDETLDTKSLIGTFICAESYGEFVFKKGPLVAAAEQGWWVILENIDKANDDIISILITFIEKGEIILPTKEGRIVAHSGFRIFATSQGDSQSSGQRSDKKNLTRYFHVLNMPEYNEIEAKDILRSKFSMYSYDDLLKLVYDSCGFIAEKIKSRKSNWSRPITFTDLIKISYRIENTVKKYYNGAPVISNNYLVEQFRAECLCELYDCLLSYMDLMSDRLKMVEELCLPKFWNLDPTQIISQLTKIVPKMQYTKENFTLTVGRCTDLNFYDNNNNEKQEIEYNANFAYTSYALRGFESISQALKHNEGLLLVGPTGVGKTLIVQQIAKMMNKKLVIYNMNCMSDASDLMGGFKPIAPKYLILPFIEQFLKLFCKIVNRDSNQAFINALTDAFNKSHYAQVFKFIDSALSSLKLELAKKPEKQGFITEIHQIAEENKNLQKKINQMKGHFAYQYIEGALVKSLQNGDWVLLDELNLASDELLQKLAPIIEGRSLTVTDRSDLLPVKRHPNFRLICCMNPGGTVGKRQLPIQIRTKFTEIFMGDLEDESDVLYLIKHVMGELNDEKLVNGLTKFYMEIKIAANRMQLQTVNNRRAVFSVRNLCRAIDFMRKAATEYGLGKSIYDAIEVCLLSQLNESSKSYCQKVLLNCIPLINSTDARNSRIIERENYELFAGYNISKGKRIVLPHEDPDKWFVRTKSFEESLKQLAKIIANTQLPILLEGQTSSGKTAMIEYLACKTHNNCIRINNHLNTDVQEYIGSYVPDATGKLYFQEGALIEAVRNGYWVILDELNLAPSEVLEALNRLLDDNREIYIAETQTMLKAHPMFRVFATQNPTEGYGGRKELSEAFRNRFISLFIPEIPLPELATVVEKRCGIAPSYAKRMVAIMEELQLNRRETDILSGKQSFITVRDLIKWATRNIISVEDIAYEGYILLAERLRNSNEKETVKKIIEKHCKTKIDIKKFYTNYCNKKEIESNIEKLNEKLKSNPIGGLTKISWTNSMKRLYALTDKCVKNKEPVLLVGETGCGKTTVCQLISLFENIPMYTISCHQNTEAADFIGGLRTATSSKNTKTLISEVQTELLNLQNLLKLLPENEEFLKILTETPSENFSLVKKNIAKLSKLLNNRQEMIISEIKEIIKKINEIINQEGKIFEWKNGPLVKAMIEGGILLIDEISLTDDSVIERINSVLEKERVLVLSEKSAESVEKYIGHERFCVLATMNPGGDYGKKELSPALRNRFTEIWVDSFFTDEDFIEYAKKIKNEMNGQMRNNIIWSENAEKIDLYQVICEKMNIKDLPIKIKLSQMVLQFVCWFNHIFIKEMNIERKALSLRDVLSILEFISANYTKMLTGNCYFDAVCLIVLDGISTNSDTSQIVKNLILSEFMKFIYGQINVFELEFKEISGYEMKIVNTTEKFGFKPYLLNKEKDEKIENYCVEVKTPKENLHRILRAMSLDRPLLLEGSPGVGKTSLLEFLAKVVGRQVVSISLSEQTDMMDLLGCEYPVTSEYSVTNKPEFKWCDGILLKAVKEGWWVLIDELNLASQSVLEGLNAILDHRKTIFIPELNAEFVCHPQFRFFATQSPAKQGAARKNLPKSFMNRFAKIYLDSLTEQDLVGICTKLYPEINEKTIVNLIKFNEKCKELKENYTIQSNIEYNLRDLKRVLQLSKSSVFKRIDESVKIIYLRNIRQKMDRQKIKQIFNEIFGQKLAKSNKTLEISLTDSEFCCGNSKINMQNQETSEIKISQEGKTLLGKERKIISELINCVNNGWPMIISGPEATGKTILVKKLASLTNNKIIEIVVSPNTDSTELLGFYEQANINTLLHASLIRLEEIITQIIPRNPNEILNSEISNFLGLIEKCRYYYKNKSQSESDSLHILIDLSQLLKEYLTKIPILSHFLLKIDSEISYLTKISEIMRNGKFAGRFEWIDSELVKGIENGSWVIIKNANSCNPSILDRINPLLDDDSSNNLIINEAGIIGEKFRTVIKNPNFRLFFVYDYKLGELSRSLRNRCVELSLKNSGNYEILGEKPLSNENICWINCLQKWLKFDRSDYNDQMQILKRVGIKSDILANLMIKFNTITADISKSSVNMRNLIIWAKLFMQMTKTNSNTKKSLIWSSKIAYSQYIQKIPDFEKILNECYEFTKIHKEKIGQIFEKFDKNNGILQKIFGSCISAFGIHNIEIMLKSPEFYWENYNLIFLNLIEYTLNQLEVINKISQNNTDSMEIIKNGKRENSEKSILNLAEIHSGFLRNLHSQGIEFYDNNYGNLSNLLLKMLPIMEYEAKNLMSILPKSNLKIISKILLEKCSELNKNIRENPNFTDHKLIEILTMSDIENSIFSQNKQVDKNSYFPKKLSKLRKLVHSLISQYSLENSQKMQIIRMTDFALYKSMESGMNLGISIYPCILKLRKFAENSELLKNDQFIRILEKLTEKSIVSCQIDKKAIQNTRKNQNIIDLIKFYEFDTFVPKTENIYKILEELTKIMSPFIHIIGNRQESNNYTVDFSEDLEKQIKTIFAKFSELYYSNENQNYSEISQLLKNLREYYENASKININSIVINIGDLDEKPDDENNDNLLRIPIIEQIKDIKKLKHKNLIDLPMLLKDLQEIQNLFSNSVNPKLLKRFMKRRTIIPMNLFVRKNENNNGMSDTEKIWKNAGLILAKNMCGEYSNFMQKLMMNGPIKNKSQFVLEYTYENFWRNVKLSEISYKMDYMLKMRKLCHEYKRKDNKNLLKVGLFSIEKIILGLNSENIFIGILKEFSEIMNSYLKQSELYVNKTEEILKSEIHTNLLKCMEFCTKYQSNCDSQEIKILLNGISTIISSNIKLLENCTLENILQLSRLYEIILHILMGKLLIIIGYPSLNLSHQLKLPIYIEFSEDFLQKLCEEFTIKKWIFELRTQNYSNSDLSSELQFLQHLIDNNSTKLTEYRRKYRYKDVSQLGALISLLDSIEAKSVSSLALLDSVYSVFDKKQDKSTEILTHKATISQGLIKILTNYLNCNQDVLIFYIIGLGIIQKGYSRLNKAGKDINLVQKIVKYDEIDYIFNNKKCDIQQLSDKYLEILKSIENKPEKSFVLYKQILAHYNNNNENTHLLASLKMKYLQYIIERYLELENKDNDGTYKYHGKSLSEKIMAQYRSIDEMTKSENMLKKAEAKKKELEDEFSQYLSPEQSLEKFVKRVRELPEKLESKIHKVILDNIIIKDPKCLEIQTSIKLSNIHSANFSESLIQTELLMKNTLDILSKKIENLDQEISAPYSTYHFYKDPNPAEVKLVHNPVMQLLARLNTLLKEYPGNLILQTTAQMCDRLLAFDVYKTPVAKIMTGLEMVVGKAHEWQALASKRLNSIDKELGQIYRVVIRYRKLQLITWSTLFNSKKEDYEKSGSETRIASMLIMRLGNENSVKEGENIQSLFNSVDQYLLNSNMATFEYRYKVIETIYNYRKITNITGDTYITNMLKYVLNYYKPYIEKFQEKFKDLIKPVKDKMTELIKIARWDISNYYAFSNCINHNHIQLMRIIKDYDDVLKQPFSTTVFVQLRTSTVLSESHVWSLQPDTEIPINTSEILPYCTLYQEMNDAIHARILEAKQTESKSVRRRALVDLFKKLKEEKIDSAYKKILAQGGIYQKEHFDTENLAKIFENDKNAMMSIEKISKYYYKSMDNVNVILTLPAFHEHLSIHEIEGMKGFGVNLVNIMVKYAEKIMKIEQELEKLNLATKKLPSNIKSDSVIYNSKNIIENITELIKILSNSEQIFKQISEISHNNSHSDILSKINSCVEIYENKLKRNIEIVEKLLMFDSKLIENLLDNSAKYSEKIDNFVENLENADYEFIIPDLQKHSWIIKQKIKQIRELLIVEKLQFSENIEISNKIANLTIKINEIIESNKNKILPTTQFEDLLLELLLKQEILTQVNSDLMPLAISKPNISDIQKLQEFLKNIKLSITGFLQRGIKHMHNFSRVVQLITTIFANLLKNGFCVHEENDDEAEANENQRMIEEISGMGLGEGKGKQDVSEQIEHEEQIEGLKGDQEDENNEPENKQDLDKGFDMEEDFKGDMNDLGEEGKKEAEEKKEGDLQRELDENLQKPEENKLWDDENDLPLENPEDDKEPEGDIQDLGNKKADPLKDSEKQMKASEDKKQNKNGDDENSENEKNQEIENEENKEEFKETVKDEDFHIEKNEQMEPEDSEKEDLSLSMNSQQNEENEENDENMESEFSENQDQNAENPENLEPEEISNEVENGEQKSEPENENQPEDKKEEILPKGAPTSAPNENQEKMPFGEEEEQQAAGQKSEKNEGKMLFSQFDIAKVVNEEFEKKETEKRKKEQNEPIKGKLGDKSKNVNKDQVISAEKERETEDRKILDDDEVVAQEENKNEENTENQEAAQAIGETLMELGKENVAEGEFPEDEKNEKNNENIENMADIEQEKTNQKPKIAENNAHNQANQPKNTEKSKNQTEKNLEKMTEDMKIEVPDEKMELDKNEISGEEKKMEFDKEKDIKESGKVEKDLIKISQYLSPEKYEEEKNLALKLYQEWLSVPEKSASANEMLQKFESLTRSLSASLCEQLRILLEPTQRTKLKGDYKTGKRLNMKKIIPFLASNYRNDKIWMRRSVPNKRDYKIFLMIDDSLSMKEHGLGFFALESVVSILQALDILEIGEVCVGAMRENLKIVHGFNEKYSRQKASYILSSFGFDFNEVNSSDYSLANCINDANHILELQHFNARTISIIICDGRFNKVNVKPFLTEAAEKGHTYVMIILDNYGKDPTKSILNMKTTKWVEKNGKKELEIISHLQDFPFEFYCVLQDIAQLPFTLSNVLLNWFKQTSWS